MTIPQLSKKYNKPECTIRRVITRLRRDDPQEYSKFVRKKPTTTGFTYDIDEKLLTKLLKIPPTHPPTQNDESPVNKGLHPPTQDSDPTVVFLMKQIEVKDSQIAEFQEAQKRGDVLQQQLQNRILQLEAPKPAQTKIIKKGFWHSVRQNRV